MGTTPTNAKIRRLLFKLGFAQADLVANNHRVFRHPESGAVIVFPDNRDDEAARPADIASIRDHLALHGHLEANIFDRYVADGKLPAA